MRALSGKLQATKILDDLSATGSVGAGAAGAARVCAARRHGAAEDPRSAERWRSSPRAAISAMRRAACAWSSCRLQLDDTHLKGSVALGGGAAGGEVRAHGGSDQCGPISQRGEWGGGAAPQGRRLEDGEQESPRAKRRSRRRRTARSRWRRCISRRWISPMCVSPWPRRTMWCTCSRRRRRSTAAAIPATSRSIARGATPALSLDEHLSGVDMAPLAGRHLVQGTRVGARQREPQGHGARRRRSMRSCRRLNGHFDANLADGALEGVDLGYEIGLAQALDQAHGRSPRAAIRARTKFDAVQDVGGDHQRHRQDARI